MKQVCVAWLLLLCVTGAAGACSPACAATETCDVDTCKANIGQACNTSATPAVNCLADHTCDSTCKGNAGQSCNTSATPTEQCVDTATCEGGKCKANTGQTCDGATVTCVAGHTCDDGKCKKKVNESCTASDDCAGSNVECSTSKLCTCTAGKSANADKSDCSGVSGLAGSVFLLIAALVTSRFLCTTTSSTVREIMGTA